MMSTLSYIGWFKIMEDLLEKKSIVHYKIFAYSCVSQHSEITIFSRCISEKWIYQLFPFHWCVFVYQIPKMPNIKVMQKIVSLKLFWVTYSLVLLHRYKFWRTNVIVLINELVSAYDYTFYWWIIFRTVLYVVIMKVCTGYGFKHKQVNLRLDLNL